MSLGKRFIRPIQKKSGPHERITEAEIGRHYRQRGGRYAFEPYVAPKKQVCMVQAGGSLHECYCWALYNRANCSQHQPGPVIVVEPPKKLPRGYA